MAHDELKQGKGRRGAPLPDEKEYAEMYNDIKKNSHSDNSLSLQDIVENSAVVNALADILIIDGVIKEKDGIDPINRIDKSADLYGGVLAGLIMILKEDGIIPDLESKLNDGIIAAHRTMMHFGSRVVNLDIIVNYRQEFYKAIRASRRK